MTAVTSTKVSLVRESFLGKAESEVGPKIAKEKEQEEVGMVKTVRRLCLSDPAPCGEGVSFVRPSKSWFEVCISPVHLLGSAV